MIFFVVLQIEKVIAMMIMWQEKNLHIQTHAHTYTTNKRKEKKPMALVEGKREKKKKPFHVSDYARLIT